ncbi:MAG: hypothetical protein NUW37_05775 [Planctomycetes bacterium]|nr:hypothetical protein [Planctomycetota bacterium]
MCIEITSEFVLTLFSTGALAAVSYFGIVIPNRTQKQKVKWEIISSKKDRILNKAENLISSLTKFRNSDYLKKTSGDIPARIELRANHAGWEMAIFSDLLEYERVKIKEMREKRHGIKYLLESDEFGELNAMILIKEVMELTCSAVERLDKKLTLKSFP